MWPVRHRVRLQHRLVLQKSHAWATFLVGVLPRSMALRYKLTSPSRDLLPPRLPGASFLLDLINAGPNSLPQPPTSPRPASGKPLPAGWPQSTPSCSICMPAWKKSAALPISTPSGAAADFVSTFSCGGTSLGRGRISL